MDAVGAESAGDDLAGGVVAAAPDEARLCAERARPGGDIGGLAAGNHAGLRHPVVSEHERVVEADDHVEEQIAEGRQTHLEYDRRMDGASRGSRLRSFAIGGLVGAAGAIAAARRSSNRSRRPRNAPVGLAAFEDAPCFLELVGEEAQRYREGGDTSSGPLNST